jgi:hypothetical protein
VVTAGPPELPEPSERFAGGTPLEGELRRQMAILEGMFADPGLAGLRSRHPEHPAVAKFDALRHVAGAGKPLRTPDELAAVRTVAEMLMDRSAWAVAPSKPDGYWGFITDPAARKHVEDTILVDRQFDETIAELFVWGWLRQEGFPAELIGEEAKPDTLVGRASSDEVWVEVKCVNEGSVERAVVRQIDKANKQIKRVNPTGSGVVFLRIDRPIERAAFDDRIPSDVRPYLAEVEAALSGTRFKSVARAVLTWDDVLILGDPPRRTLYLVRRRSVVADHAGPRSKMTIPAARYEVGRTVTIWATWSSPDSLPAAPQGSRPMAVGELDVSELFRAESAEIVRPAHAAEAFLDPDGLSVFDFEGFEFSLATRRIEMEREPYTLLVIAFRQPGERKQLSLAFRVFDNDNGGTPADPEDCLDVLLRRHGLVVTVGDQAGLLVQGARLKVGSAGPSTLIRISDSDADRAIVTALVRIDGAGSADLAWVFAIDRDNYQRDVRAHRR